jgi:hypothetical protein
VSLYSWLFNADGRGGTIARECTGIQQPEKYHSPRAMVGRLFDLKQHTAAPPGSVSSLAYFREQFKLNLLDLGKPFPLV